MTSDNTLELAFVRVTENAAIAAAQTMGLGDRKESDRVAVEAMRETLGTVEIAGRVVIGEGERDEAPMLYVGEEVGAGSLEAAHYGEHQQPQPSQVIESAADTRW